MDNDLLNLWLLPAPTREDMRALVEEVQELRAKVRKDSDLYEIIDELRAEVRGLEQQLSDADGALIDLRAERAGR